MISHPSALAQCKGFLEANLPDARLEAAIKRFAIWGKVYDNEKFAAKAKSMQKRLDKMDRIEKLVRVAKKEEA